MIRLFDSISNPVYKDGVLTGKDAIFCKDFGPWKEGYKCANIKLDYRKGVIYELTDSGNIACKSEVMLLSKGSKEKLDSIINWMDDPNNEEKLYTKDGREVYRFYSDTLIDKFLRELHKEATL